jgi:hypothetical protein
LAAAQVNDLARSLSGSRDDGPYRSVPQSPRSMNGAPTHGNSCPANLAHHSAQDSRPTWNSPIPAGSAPCFPSRRNPLLSAGVPLTERIACYGLTAWARSRTIGAGNGWGVADAWDAAVATSGCVGLRGVVLKLPLERRPYECRSARIWHDARSGGGGAGRANRPRIGQRSPYPPA